MVVRFYLKESLYLPNALLKFFIFSLILIFESIACIVYKFLIIIFFCAYVIKKIKVLNLNYNIVAPYKKAIVSVYVYGLYIVSYNISLSYVLNFFSYVYIKTRKFIRNNWFVISFLFKKNSM